MQGIYCNLAKNIVNFGRTWYSIGVKNVYNETFDTTYVIGSVKTHTKTKIEKRREICQPKEKEIERIEKLSLANQIMLKKTICKREKQ